MALGEIVYQSAHLLIEEVKFHPSFLDVFTQFYQDDHPFLLGSEVVSKKMGRYSVMGSFPWLILRSKGSNIELINDGKSVLWEGNPFMVIRQVMARLSPLIFKTHYNLNMFNKLQQV